MQYFLTLHLHVHKAMLLKKRLVTEEGREGVKWELGLALLWTGKMGFTPGTGI